MTCPFSIFFNKFKFIFGKPNEGIHSYRFANTAIIDYILTIIVSMFYANYKQKPLVLTTILFFILGIIFHILFGIDTDTIKFIKSFLH